MAASAGALRREPGPDPRPSPRAVPARARFCVLLCAQYCPRQQGDGASRTKIPASAQTWKKLRLREEGEQPWGRGMGGGRGATEPRSESASARFGRMGGQTASEAGKGAEKGALLGRVMFHPT